MQVSLPEAGEVVEYQLAADVPVKFNFYVSEVLFSCDGNDLILTGENGGGVVLKDYQAMAQQNELPTFLLNSGEEVPGDIYLFAFSDSEQSIETAAGGTVDGMEAADDGATISPNEWLEPLLNPEVDEAGEPSSFFESPPSGSSTSAGILTIDSIFSDYQTFNGASGSNSEIQGVTPLAGASPLHIEMDLSVGSLVDVYDLLMDTIQHIIDSPELV